MSRRGNRQPASVKLAKKKHGLVEALEPGIWKRSLTGPERETGGVGQRKDGQLFHADH